MEEPELHKNGKPKIFEAMEEVEENLNNAMAMTYLLQIYVEANQDDENIGRGLSILENIIKGVSHIQLNEIKKIVNEIME